MMFRLVFLASLAFTKVAAQSIRHPRVSHMPQFGVSHSQPQASPTITSVPLGLPFGNLNIQKPELQCPRHFSLSGDLCVRTDDRPLRAQCPARGRLENGVCVVENVIEPRKMCPEGALLVNGLCTITETTGTIKNCPREYVLQGDECVKTQETRAMISCPTGYRNNSELQACSREIRSPPQVSCADGSHPTRDGRCSVRSETEVVRRCEHGYVLEQDTCAKQSTPGLVCPQGYKRDGATCVRHQRVDAQPVCPDGETFDGRFCVKTSTTPVQLSCSRDFELKDGKCVKVIEEEVRVDCATGFRYEVTREGPVCLFVERKKPELFCANGNLVGRRCDILESSAPVPEDRCIPGTTDESCYKKPRVSCPLGFRLTDDRCVSKNEVKAASTCPAGQTLMGRDCVQLDIVPLTKECRFGAELSLTGTCVSVTTSELHQSCPKTYKMQDSRCMLIREFSPVETCPSGSAQVGRKCVAVERVPPKVACTGTSDDATDCIQLETREPRQVCDRDYRLVGGVCIGEQPVAAVTQPQVAVSSVNPMRSMVHRNTLGRSRV